jgi:hypothetical protein
MMGSMWKLAVANVTVVIVRDESERMMEFGTTSVLWNTVEV